MTPSSGTIGLIGLAMLMLASAEAAAQSRPQSGTLTCDMGPSVGLIVGSRQHMRCVCRNSATGRTET